MCGIAGYFCPDGVQPETPDIARMLRVMGHRGPDGNDVHRSEDGRTILGFVRLAIIDLTTGDQPLVDMPHGRVLVGNGEIYNYKELRAAPNVADYAFKTAGDMETILALAASIGDDYVEHLNGMFGLALYEERPRRLQLVRDRLGIKPVYWIRTPKGGVIFASEIKGVLASGLIERRIDETAVTAYLRHGYVPGPGTLFAGVRKVMPGHRLFISASGECVEEAYWTPHPASDLPKEATEITLYLSSLLEDSVRLQLRADVPLGVLLSGGIDSGLVVALAARHVSTSLQTYTVRFEGTGVPDESTLAQQVATRYGTDHALIDVPSVSVLDALPDLAWHCDEPQNDPALLPNFLIEQALGHTLKVALNGTGGDELFAGYGRYFMHGAEHRYRMLPGPLRRGLVAPLIGAIDPMTGFRLNRAELWDTDPGRYLHDHTTMFPNPILRWIGHEAQTDVARQSDFARIYDGPRQTKMLAADLQTYLPENLLTLLDRTSMACSVEGRVPFLDHRMVEAALAVPPNVRTPGGRQKGLERDIAQPLLPADILNAPKRGFAAPANAWAKSGMAPLAERLLTRPNALARGWWTAEGVRFLCADPGHQGFRIYALLMLELAVLMHVENPSDAPTGATLTDLAEAV